jgi:hypothetical protein
MVVKGGCQSTCIVGRRLPADQISGNERPCRDAGVGEIALGLAMLKRANRASHIDPPASSNAIMRRARPYRGENPEPGKDVTESLTPRPELENKIGMHQPADFQFVMAGAHPQRWEALKAGTLDAAIQLVPFNYIAEDAGFPNLGDVDEYVPDFLFCAVCTRMSWATENRDRVIGLLRALRRGAEALYDDPNGAVAVVLDQMSINPEHARRACQEFVSKKVIPRDLSINPRAFATTFEAMRRGELINSQPQSEMQACIDTRFLSAGEA